MSYKMSLATSDGEPRQRQKANNLLGKYTNIRDFVLKDNCIKIVIIN